MPTIDPISLTAFSRIGIPEVDRQHEELTTLINELIDAFNTHHAAEFQKELVERISDYARTHFLLEEELMTRAGYPRMDDHCAEHAQFFGKSVDFLLAGLDDKNVSLEALAYLSDWWITHINGTDTQLGTWLRDNGKL